MIIVSWRNSWFLGHVFSRWLTPQTVEQSSNSWALNSAKWFLSDSDMRCKSVNLSSYNFFFFLRTPVKIFENAISTLQAYSTDGVVWNAISQHKRRRKFVLQGPVQVGRTGWLLSNTYTSLITNICNIWWSVPVKTFFFWNSSAKSKYH